MKRIISIVVILFTLTSLFAQNAKYKELLEKARSYESNNEWAYALGYYADAITADPLNALEAAEKFNSISDSIESGNPGLTPVTGRLQMEAWENLLCNTEKYFTENFPYFVNFSQPQMKNKNGKNYDYWSNVDYSFNFKFNRIVLPILKGYKEVYRGSWGLPDVFIDDDAQYIINYDRYISPNYSIDLYWDIKHSSWPITSVTKIKNPEMVKDGYGYYVQVDKNDSSYYYNKVATYCGAYYGFYNSFAVLENEKTLYELTLVIADEKGKALCSPVKYMLGSDTVTFENIPENIADMIDNETARIKVTGIALKYGYVNDKEPVESLPSVSVNSSNAEIYDSVDTKKIVKLFRRDYESERGYDYYLYDYFKGTVKHVDSFSVACYKYREEKDIREKYDGILSSVENNTVSKVDSSYYQILKWRYDEGRLEMSDEYVANRFSAYEGVTPCYDEFCNPIDGNGYRKTEDGSRRYERKLSPVELEEYKKQLKSFYEPEMNKYERLVALKNNYQLGREDSTRVSKLIESFTNLKTAVEQDDFKKINDLVPQLKETLSEEDLLKLETICAEREKKEILAAITARKSQMLDKISEYHNKKFNMSANKVNEYSIISMAIEESRKSVEELAAAATADASLEVLREVKDKFETITTENLDLLLAEIEKGKELISKMGIKLTFYSSYSYRAISIYSLEVEKNSIAKKTKVKGKRLIFDEEFNPHKGSRESYYGDGYITDCSFADFCIRIARSSGKEFALYTSKKDEPFMVKVP